MNERKRKQREREDNQEDTSLDCKPWDQKISMSNASNEGNKMVTEGTGWTWHFGGHWKLLQLLQQISKVLTTVSLKVNKR